MEIDINNILQSYIMHLIKQNESLEPIPENDPTENILERLAFIEFIDSQMELVQNKLIRRSFVRSLQVYLLLSAGDSLGNGSNFYSFQEYLSSKSAAKVIASNQGVTLNNEVWTTLITKLEREYKNSQNIKQKFQSFWFNRSEVIKHRIVLCFYPFEDTNWNTKYSKIVDIFYDQYRNPFTHASLNNFPPVGNIKYPSGIYKDEIIGIGYTDKKGNINNIELPLFLKEAEEIIENKVITELILGDGRRIPKDVMNPDQLVSLNNQLNSYKNMDGTYVHNGIIKLLKMAIIEGCKEKSA